MQIILIAAVSLKGGIGYQGKLPWYLPEDLKYFREQTVGSTVIMGRKTFESIGKPLPERHNMVLSTNSRFDAKGASVFPSLDLACAAAATEKVYVIGGEQVYKDALPFANKILLTVVELKPVCDAFFPAFNMDDWRLTNLKARREFNGIYFRFTTWIKI